MDLMRDRRSIHFGNWDGDGVSDILAAEKCTGRVEWWRNRWTPGKAPSGQAPTFDDPKSEIRRLRRRWAC
ncbi:hypothetical protein MFIFM68171_05522 [Madurella fahalii]|uniref:Uncharacterized protein n=1 Tax=Madurella fahalii TaxID=1157608 RepID=A0ABQ0GC46_9PEZI